MSAGQTWSLRDLESVANSKLEPLSIAGAMLYRIVREAAERFGDDKTCLRLEEPRHINSVEQAEGCAVFEGIKRPWGYPSVRLRVVRDSAKQAFRVTVGGRNIVPEYGSMDETPSTIFAALIEYALESLTTQKPIG
jgi:hypothetical protein